MKAFISGLILLALSSIPSYAEDCGEPPVLMPAIPDGATAERDDMLAGVQKVQEYSDKVDAYLACRETRAQTVFQWMTEEQRARWNEDLDALHNNRVDLQTSMNAEIRIFNSRVDQQDEDDVG